jgi:hypothetical protein
MAEDTTTTAPAPEPAPAPVEFKHEIRVELKAPWEGRWALVRTGVSARVALSLDNAESDLTGAIAAFTALVVDHNLPAITGEPADDLMDVDVRLVGAIMTAWREGLANLPQA